ncbi:MAG: rod shape-determining protein MreC [Lachnospiraceae bacterium]
MSPIVKRKKEKFHLASKYWLLILTCVCVLLMVVTFMTNFTGGFLNNIGGYLFKPFQEGISEVGSFLTQKSDELKEMRVLMQENERLREENAALIAENIHLQQYKNELRELQDLLELAAAYEDYETTAARIIAKDTGNWYSSFLINKGTDDGIEVDMNVIADGGLVGRVSRVGANWARVTAIIDDASNVSSMVLSTYDNLIVSGGTELMFDNKLAFSQLLDREDLVMVGDKIVTSNISEKYLPGILIGHICQINMDANNLSKSGYITPVVDFEHLSEVLIIRQKKQGLEGM